MSKKKPRCECGEIAKVQVRLDSKRKDVGSTGWMDVCNPCRWWAYAQACKYRATFLVRTFEEAREAASAKAGA